MAPLALDWLQHVALPWVQTQFGLEDGFWQLDRLKAAFTAHLGSTTDVLGMILSRATASSLALLAWIGNLLLIPVVSFYLLRDWDLIMLKLRSLLPRAGMVVRLMSECHEVIGAFLRGQLLVMLALAIIYASGLMLVGLELGLLIGVLAGLASIVPYMGFVVGIGAAVIAALFQFGLAPYPLIGVAVVFTVGQMLEGMLLTPLLVGDRIGLHPVAVIFAVLAGGQLFGFTGVLLALPVAAVIMVLLRHVHDLYKLSDLYAEPAGAPAESTRSAMKPIQLPWASACATTPPCQLLPGRQCCGARLFERLCSPAAGWSDELIYLWGQPGVGRSHLLQAACLRVEARRAGRLSAAGRGCRVWTGIAGQPGAKRAGLPGRPGCRAGDAMGRGIVPSVQPAA